MSTVLPLHLLKRHALAMEAHFDFVLVFTYAFPKDVLEPLLPPGLQLDLESSGQLGFVAVAVVKTLNMRPKGFLKTFSQDYMLIGYRIFVRYLTGDGRKLRGLKIMRSDTDSGVMVALGNVLTRYGFHRASIDVRRDGEALSLKSRSDDRVSDLDIVARLDCEGDYLPEGSPFSTVREALKFAGPMPFTFDYERETGSIIRVEGVRQNWQPKPVSIEVRQAKFFEQEHFTQAEPILCSAFYLSDIPYWWKPGVCETLNDTSARNAGAGEDDSNSATARK